MKQSEKLSFFQSVVEDIPNILKNAKKHHMFFKSMEIIMRILGTLQCLDEAGIFINHVRTIDLLYVEIVSHLSTMEYVVEFEQQCPTSEPATPADT